MKIEKDRASEEREFYRHQSDALIQDLRGRLSETVDALKAAMDILEDPPVGKYYAKRGWEGKFIRAHTLIRMALEENK